MKWVLEAAGHWWMLGRCCSWWTQSWRGPKVSGLSPASVEEAGCRQWRALDCKHSLLLLIQIRGRSEGSKVSKGGGRRGEMRAKEILNIYCIHCLDNAGQSRQDPHFTSK